jgi:hypothetical protein
MCARGGGDRNGRKERHEVIIRKRRDGDKVELDCLPSRGQAKGIIYKYATRELNGWGRGERRRRMQSHGGVDDASGRRVPNTMFFFIRIIAKGKTARVMVTKARRRLLVKSRR